MVQLLPAQVEVPPGVTVTRLTPAWLRVTLARAGVKSLRIVPRLHGSPAPGYALHGIGVDPETVEVRGPRSTIEPRATIETAPVDIAGGRERFSRSVGLALPDSVLLTRDREVQVTVDIRPEEAMKRGARR